MVSELHSYYNLEFVLKYRSDKEDELIETMQLLRASGFSWVLIVLRESNQPTDITFLEK